MGKIDKLLKQVDKQTAAGNMEAANKLIDIIDRLTQEGIRTETEVTGSGKGRYVYARVLTLADGSKCYHPLVGMLRSSGNKEDYKMESYDNILDLQESEIGQAVKYCIPDEYYMEILFVPEKTYAELELKLEELIDGVFEHLGNAANEITAAAAFLGIQQDADEAIQKQAEVLFDNKPLVSGTGLNRNMELVERTDYVDEEVTVDRGDDYDECDDCPCAGCDIECNSLDCASEECGASGNCFQ